MNKFQKMMSVTLAGCMAASALMGSAGAANVQTGTTPAPVAAPQNVRGTVTPSTMVKLNTNSSNQIVPWSVYSGYGYWKIHVINTSKSRMTVKIHKDFPTGELVCAPMYIPAGGAAVLRRRWSPAVCRCILSGYFHQWNIPSERHPVL